MRPPLKIGLSPRFLHKSPLELGFRGKTLQYLEQKSVAHWVMTQDALIFMIPSIEAGRPDPAQQPFSRRLCGRSRRPGPAGRGPT